MINCDHFVTLINSKNKTIPVEVVVSCWPPSRQVSFFLLEEERYPHWSLLSATWNTKHMKPTIVFLVWVADSRSLLSDSSLWLIFSDTFPLCLSELVVCDGSNSWLSDGFCQRCSAARVHWNEDLPHFFIENWLIRLGAFSLKKSVSI